MSEYLGPGAMPHTRAESREVARGITARAATALEPYLARAGEAQLHARDQDGVLDKLAEDLGVSAEEVAEQLDVEASLQYGAIMELLADLMHVSLPRGVSFNEVYASAARIYQDQARHLQTFLVYEAPDKEPRSGVTVEWGG